MPETKKRPSTAETFVVSLDRWGNRWVTNNYWMLNLDLARTTGRLPLEVGRWQNGKPSTDPFWTARPLPKIDNALRKATKGRDFVTIAPQLDADGHRVLTLDVHTCDRTIEVWERSDGETIWLDRRFVRAVENRLPKGARAIQLRHLSHDYSMRRIVLPMPLLFVVGDQPAGVVMPIAKLAAEAVRSAAA